MPNIDINIWARLHQRSLDRSQRDLNARFQDMGREAGESLSKGIEKEAPRVRRAMLSMADASAAHAKKVRDVGKAKEEVAKASKAEAEAEAVVNDRRRDSARLGDRIIDMEDRLGEARARLGEISEEVGRQEGAHDALRRQHARNNEFLRQSELSIREARLRGTMTAKEIKDAELELIPLRRLIAEESLKLTNSERDLAASRDRLSDVNQSVRADEQNIGDARKDLATINKDLKTSEDNLHKARETGRKLDEDIVQRNEEIARSHEKVGESVRRVNEIREDEEKRRRRRGNQRGPLASVGNILTDIPGVPSGRLGALIGGPIIVAMTSLAEAAVTASQAVATLPAILTAAGAAAGTLVLGFNGFGDAIKNMGDPKKFAESLQSLSPAAQQAALEIQHLVNGPLGELQNATQETLFKGVAEQIHNVTNELLPEAQSLTQGISGSFNNMFNNFVGQLISPDSQASINEIIDNIVTGFQRLEPAVAPFTNAITKIVETGSSFLPGFGDAITNAANAFSNFITKAQADGSLKDFMQKGVDAAVALSKTIWNIGQRIFEVFGNKSPKDFQDNLNAAIDAAAGLAKALTVISEAINKLMGFINSVPGGINSIIGAFVAFKAIGFASHVAGIGSAFGLLPGAADKGAAGILAKFGKGGPVFLALTAIIAIINDMFDRQADFERRTAQFKDDMSAASTRGERDAAREKMYGPNWNKFGPNGTPMPEKGSFLYEQMMADARDGKIPGVAVDKDGNLVEPPTGSPNSVPGPLDWQDQVRPNQSRIDDHKLGTPTTAGLPNYSPFDVPGIPGDAGSSKDRRDAIRAGMDPNSFMPDVSNLPMQFPGSGPANAGQPGYQQNIDQRDIWDSAYKVQQQARDLRDARMDLAVLERDNLASEEERLHAREKVADEEHQFQKAQLDLIEAQQGKWKKATKDAKETQNSLSAGLDKDLGLSRGIAGLADNLIRFVGNLATAPLQALLQRQIDANPNEGSGLIGILAAQGKFGEQYTPGYLASNGGASGPASASGVLSNAPFNGGGGTSTGVPYGLPAGTDTGGYGSSGPAFPGWVHQMEQMFGVKASTYSGHQESDRHEAGYAPNPNHENRGIDWTGSPQAMQALADYMSKLPGAEQVIYRNPVTGQDTEAVAGQARPGYFASDLAGHANHVHTRQSQALPLPDGSMPAGGGGMPGLSSSGPSGGGTPVFVMNWPGGFTPGAPGGSPGAASSGPTSPGGTGGMNFDALAQKEASGNWQANTGNGYYGDLQFDQKTWDAYKPSGAPARADLASKDQQIAAAMRGIQDRGGPQSLWPQNYGTLGSTTPGGPIPSAGQSGPGQLPGSPLAGNFPGSQPYAPTPQNQPQPQWQPAGGGGGGGGLLGAAGGAAAGMFPGGGAAAQIAMQMIQRTIKFGGEVGGALAQGALSSLSVSDPDGGGGTDMSQSWLGRLAGSMASAAPALPSNAGKADKGAQAPAADPNAPQQGAGNGQQGQQPLIGNLTVQADRATGEKMAGEMAYAGYSSGLMPGS